ncbi:MAG: aspartate kinase [Neisseriales bacterium]|nr:MAG: aspartate kinase [Neisseriales bacterium]
MRGSKRMLVMKFGGTSVTNPLSVAAIAKQVRNNLEQKPIIVVSALSGVTDLLVKLSNASNKGEIQDILGEIRLKHQQWIDNIFSQNSPCNQNASAQIDFYLEELEDIMQAHDFISSLARHDSIVAFGEKMSSYLISRYLVNNKIQAERLLATKCIITNNNFGGADFLSGETILHSKKNILPLVENEIVPVITGFIGATVNGETTILGRGGSDYSAAIIGYAIGAKEIQIWTDVDGVFSADPRKVTNARLINQLSYQEAAELAMFGAKVLHPRTIQPAVKADIPVRVLNTFNLDNHGTLINHDADNTHHVKAVTWRKDVPLINISSPDMFLSKGFLQRVFAILSENNISVNMLSASEVSVSVTLDNVGNLEDALKQLNEFAVAEYRSGLGSISLVGEKIMDTPSLMQNVFNLLEDQGLKAEMLSYSASNINLSMVIASESIEKIVPKLHDQFIIS